MIKLIGESKAELKKYKEFIYAGLEEKRPFDPLLKSSRGVLGDPYFVTRSERKTLKTALEG